LEKSSNRVGRCQSRSPIVWILMRSSSLADSVPMPGMRVTGRSSEVAGGPLVECGAMVVTSRAWRAAGTDAGTGRSTARRLGDRRSFGYSFRLRLRHHRLQKRPLGISEASDVVTEQDRERPFQTAIRVGHIGMIPKVVAH